MTSTSQNGRIRRSLGIGIISALVGTLSMMGANVLSAASPAGAVTVTSVSGSVAPTADPVNGEQQNMITGSGFTPNGLVNVFVFRQSPALTGANAGGGRNELTTQLTAFLGQPCIRHCSRPAGTFSLTFDNPDSGGSPVPCEGTSPYATFTIEAQDVSEPSVWATATYSTYGSCLE